MLPSCFAIAVPMLCDVPHRYILLYCCILYLYTICYTPNGRKGLSSIGQSIAPVYIGQVSDCDVHDIQMHVSMCLYVSVRAFYTMQTITQLWSASTFTGPCMALPACQIYPHDPWDVCCVCCCNCCLLQAPGALTLVQLCFLLAPFCNAFSAGHPLSFPSVRPVINTTFADNFGLV